MITLDNVFLLNADQCGSCKCAYAFQLEDKPVILRCWRNGRSATVRCHNYVADNKAPQEIDQT